MIVSLRNCKLKIYFWNDLKPKKKKIPFREGFRMNSEDQIVAGCLDELNFVPDLEICITVIVITDCIEFLLWGLEVRRSILQRWRLEPCPLRFRASRAETRAWGLRKVWIL